MKSTIRLATPDDAAECRKIYAPIVESTPTSFELAVPTVEDLAGRIADTLRRTPWAVCEDGGAITGYAYACGHREIEAYQWSVEVSAYVSSNCRRRQGFHNAYAGA